MGNSTLTNSYAILKDYYLNTSPDGYNFNYAADRLLFIDERMREDAQALNFNISTAFQSNNGEFVLPDDFNESSGRIIALTTAMYSGMCEYHFYVRNGNGTCTNGHGGNCSMWSHKQSYKTISNTMINSTIVLCGDNIFDNANAGIYSNYNKGGEDDSTVRFYTITQDANLYNSWHEYGHDDNSAGTPYLSLT